MNDAEEFLSRFEDCTLPAASFHHREHVRVVWLYVQRYSLLETVKRFSEGLKRFATANGSPNRYHETITWAYAFLIHERVAREGERQTWDEFVTANADLFDWKESVLRNYYSDETLKSALARKTFVFPDR